MIYLLSAILCSSLIAIVFKVTETKNLNRYLITLFNYLTASLISLYFLINNSLVIFKKAPINDLLVLTIIGFTTGFLFYYSFILYQKNIKNHGASITGMFIKLGILIPMFISIILWKEYPSTIQTIAIIGSISAIILINLNFKSESTFEFKFNLILLFFIGGMAEFANKIFQKYFLLKYKPLFLFIVFFSAFLFSLNKVKSEKIKLNKREFKFGILVGFFNLFSSFFLIESLQFVKTSIAFALFSSLSMSLILIISFLFFKEKLKNKDKLAITITIISLFIINKF